MKNVLIVDDEKNFRLTLSVWLREFAAEFNTLMAADGQEAVEVLRNTPVDLVATDLKMPRMDGFGLLSYMKQNHPSLPVVVMTAKALTSAEVLVLEEMASVVVKKGPAFEEELRAQVRSHLAAATQT